MRLQHTLRLDPRIRPAEPWPRCVNIPWNELAPRVHELPPRSRTIEVLSCEEAEPALRVLGQLERQRVLVPSAGGTAEGRWRLWEPNEFLQDWYEGGTALDLACGSGRDAVFMADQGSQVTAVDHLPDAIALGADLERRYSQGPRIQWRVQDACGFRPGAYYDLVTCFFFLDRAVLKGATGWLAPAGLLLVETFTSVHREHFGKPRTESFVLQEGELLDLARGLQVLHYEEAWHNGRHTARLAARPAINN